VRSVYDTDSRTIIGMANADLTGLESWPTTTQTDPATQQPATVADIDILMDPLQADGDTTDAGNIADRPARFVRVIQAVATPPDVDNDLIGRSNGHEMRSIVGYAPIEPDGSFQIALPPDIPFALEVLDAQGRKYATHSAWLQVKAGETLRCHGCHSPRDGRDSLHTGAATTNVAFPNTEFLVSGSEELPQLAETMAEMRARLTCPGAGCSQTLSLDINYEDVWTDVNVRAADPAYSLTYTGLATLPVTAGCAVNWTTGCRIVINYEQHIHPLWQLSRPVAAYMYAGVMITDNQCNTCHSTANPDTSGVPAAGLSLADGASADVAVRFNSYEELLNTAQIAALSARRSYFFEKMTGLDLPASDAGHDLTNSVDHTTMLSAAELKLITEWVDQGAQYNNDPSRVLED
jgi:hypothetical protein